MPTISNELADEFRARLQGTYGAMLQACGIDSGDITPGILRALQTAEATLAEVVADWIIGHVDLQVMATVPDDRTGSNRVRAAILAMETRYPAGDG